ncbi:MAG: biotin--[acetyl-CoA-carboxylase] ligase [Deltaproteobacteria bacterium]|nr:biotin--[acetyl-CoA-carboxylase] ligase [Deltaproteobacteria bacterium]
MDGMPFDAEAVRSMLAGRKIGAPLFYHESVDSTNRVALRLAREGAAEGTVVLADRQTAGRGRLNRGWQSPPGSNLYFSVILRPTIAPSDAAQITLMAGVAVAEAVSSVSPGVGIKWPNDVRIRGLKVCGILSEMRMEGGKSAVIVGIGLNVNIRKSDFDAGHIDTATSLREETGRCHSRERLFVLLCERLERWYSTFLRDGFDAVRAGWLLRSEMAGKRVRVLFRDEVKEGMVAGIDRDGALLISGSRGGLRRITAGDATILKE